MSVKPESFSERPCIDTLGLLLSDIHMTGGSYVFSEFAAPCSFRIHTPNIASFHIILEGHAWLRMLPDGEPIPLKKGDLIVFPEGADHVVFSGTENTTPPYLNDYIKNLGVKRPRFFRVAGNGDITHMVCGYFRVDMSLAKPILSALPIFLHLKSNDGKLHEWLTLGINFVIQETLQARPAHQTIINRIFDILFVECMREYIETMPQDNRNWLSALHDPYLSRTLSAIHRDPAATWTIELLAKEARLSRSALACRFTAILGQGIMEYLTHYRMRLAKWWLRASSLPLARIAEKIGYSSESALSQAFKRQEGCSPRQYRIEINRQPETFKDPF